MAAPKSSFSIIGLPLWSVAAPPVGLLLAALGLTGSGAMVAAAILVLMATVLAAVHHAESIAHYLGEPFGTLVLALAVTVIETALIVSLMLAQGDEALTLARDTVFSAIMIVMNGIIGLCLLAGGHRHHEQRYTQYGVSAGLAMISTLAVLTLVLPNYTISAPGPVYSARQLVFVAVTSLVIYATFVIAQTIRHRDDFLHVAENAPQIAHGIAQSRRTIVAAAIVLGIALVGVVLLAKALSPTIESWLIAAGAPRAMLGIVIAALVLLPEGLAATRAARRDEVQTSLNLALGSAMATIGLTIPAVAVVAWYLQLDLVLGLSLKSTVLLALTLFVASLSLGTGRTTFVQGLVHLVIFATFVFTTLVP